VCLILVTACVIIRTRLPLLLLWVLGALTWWGVAAAMAPSPAFTLTSWLDTWIFAAFVGVGVLLVTQSERRSMSSRHRSDEVAATVDPLTGLLNRRGFGQRADHLRRIAHRRHEALWCAFIDVDHFKQVNDLWGHSAGDSVLTAVADAVSAAARESDITGRWGGDEFVILGIGDRPDEHELELRIMAGIDMGDALLTARWTPGVTVGVAASGADVGEGMALVSDADHRMYARRALRRA
jgi:diguanylate cyclase (GGDEF)-like protein